MNYLLLAVLLAVLVIELLALLVIEWRKRKSSESENEQLRARIAELEAPTDYLAKESE